MRVIGGALKGRRFDPPADNWPTRPTLDNAKEALFNIIDNTFDIEAMSVLDLFCGTGSHSYEFASRGCRDITSVDKFSPCIYFVKQQSKAFEIDDVITPVLGDAFKFIKHCNRKFSYIFAGPPYPLKEAMDKLPILVFQHKLLKPGGWFVLEHNHHHRYETNPYFIQCRNYSGHTYFSIFEMPEEPEQEDKTDI